MKSRCATVPGRSHILDSWSHRLAWPRTEPSQGLNTGSNPVGTTTLFLRSIFTIMFEDHWGWSLNMDGTSALTPQHPSRRLFIKRHHLLQARRPNHGVDLSRVDA